MSEQNSKMGAYITADIKATQPFSLMGAKCELYLKLDNIFNRRYQVHFGYPDDVIRVTSGIQARF